MFLPFKIEHIDQVHKIEVESFSSAWSRNQLISYCVNSSESKSFIYLKQKNIIGYLMSQENLEDIHIHNIAVKKDCRRKGIGSRMLLHLIDASRMNNIRKLCLEVKNINISAIKLYQSHGFIASGEKKNYYEDGSNAILMDRAF